MAIAAGRAEPRQSLLVRRVLQVEGVGDHLLSCAEAGEDLRHVVIQGATGFDLDLAELARRLRWE